MIRITRRIVLDESDLRFDFVRSSGPGGQNVNKVATAVQLRFDVRRSLALPEGVRKRLLALAGRRVSTAGILIIEAKRHRTQEQNRQDAVERLVALIRKAAVPPKRRKATQPTAESRRRRLTAKRSRGAVKDARRSVDSGED